MEYQFKLAWHFGCKWVPVGTDVPKCYTCNGVLGCNSTVTIREWEVRRNGAVVARQVVPFCRDCGDKAHQASKQLTDFLGASFPF